MAMRINLIVAMDQNQGIGFQNRLPWHLPADQRWFKQLTLGHTLIMGRKTFDSIGKPLPGRKTIVLTRNPDLAVQGCATASSLANALSIAKAEATDQVFICGGAAVYREGLKVADRIYMTRLHAEFQVDTSFPEWDPTEWEEISCELHASNLDQFPSYSFIIYQRISSHF